MLQSLFAAATVCACACAVYVPAGQKTRRERREVAIVVKRIKSRYAPFEATEKTAFVSKSPLTCSHMYM